MIRYGIRVLAVVCLVFAFAACTTPIHRVEMSNYGYGPAQGVTFDQIRGAIEKTARELGWKMSDVKSGIFIGKREWGDAKHNIAVTVLYDRNSFSIRYKNSKRMSYNGSSIHRTYNFMVERLEERIKTAVSELR